MTKIFLLSLGCDKNLVDGQAMLGLAESEGYTISAEEEAQVIIINTCGFIMDATEESIEHILRLAEYKKTGSCKALIVAGCMAQRYQKEIFRELPEVDAILGVNRLDKLPEVIKKALAKEQTVCFSSFSSDETNPEELYLLRKTETHFAYLKIAEGCDKNCTYCTIPQIKGRYRSRSLNSLLEEAKILANKGAKELILVAQDTGLYGVDLYGENRLHILLRELGKIENIKWLRLLYTYPEHITQETLREMATNPKVLPYLDLPVQHSHDYILKKMGRGLSSARLEKIIRNLRQTVPGLVLRTTIMVGFPGEKEEHFEHLQNFLKKIAFDRVGVFAYSREENTGAAYMPNQVPEETKQYRKNLIMALQEKISEKILGKKIGQTLETLIDTKTKKGTVTEYQGRTYMDCYETDGFVSFESSEDLNTGDFVKVKITHSGQYDLFGELCENFENPYSKNIAKSLK